MLHQNLRNFCDNFKSTHSCVDYLRSKGFRVPYDGSCISAPHAIRPGDSNPSFGVYNDHCYDFATQTYYDIFRLHMALENCSFSQAFQNLTGQRLSQLFSEENSQLKRIPALRQALRNDILEWHKNVLANHPYTTADGQSAGILDYLHSRHISDETVSNNLLGFNPKTQRLIFPFFKKTFETEHNDDPIINRLNQVVYYSGRDMTGAQGVEKYKKRYISLEVDHVPWGLHTLRLKANAKKSIIDNTSFNPKDDTLIICEGAVDILVFAQEGWQCLSPLGGTFRQGVLSFVLDICRQFRKVFVCFDNDAAGEQFSRTWSQRLFENHIPFVCGHIPHEDGMKDVSDYYTKGYSLDKLVMNATDGIVELAQGLNSYDAIEEFMHKAARFASTADMIRIKKALKHKTSEVEFNEDGKPIFSCLDMEIINAIIKQAQKPIPESVIADEVCSAHTLAYDSGNSFYEYSCGVWKSIPDETIIKYVDRILGARSTARQCYAVTKLLKGRLSERMDFDRQNVFTLANGVLRFDAIDKETSRLGAFEEHSPHNLSTVHVDYNYYRHAQCPQWEKFIVDISGADKSIMRNLQKAAGYIFFPDNSMQTLFYLIGRGSNGKSVFLDVLSEVFGRQNCTSLRPDRLANSFDPISLRTSIANFCYEAKASLDGAEETLKAVISGDSIMASHKGIDAVTFSPRAKWFVAANSIFETKDLSLGFRRRILFIPFTQTFSGDKADKNLTKKLLAEIDGIFNWCVEGYRMLKEDGGFDESQAQEEFLRKLEEISDPISTFCKEMLTSDVRGVWNDIAQNQYPTDAYIYKKFRMWCEDNGYKPVNRPLFNEQCESVLPKLERKRGLHPISIQPFEGRKYYVFHEYDDVILSDTLRADDISFRVLTAMTTQAAEDSFAAVLKQETYDAEMLRIKNRAYKHEKAKQEVIPEPQPTKQEVQAAKSKQRSFKDNLEEEYPDFRIAPKDTYTDSSCFDLAAEPCSYARAKAAYRWVIKHPEHWVSDLGYPELKGLVLYLNENPELAERVKDYDENREIFLELLSRHGASLI